jgi:hypothetical protein
LREDKRRNGRLQRPRRFMILSDDGKTKSAEIRIDRAFAPVEYGVKAEVRFR